jgi:hypothetical protein
LSQELGRIVEVVKAIEYFEAQQFFTYYTVNDTLVCDQCNRYDEGSMTRREIEGTFPYLIKYTDTMWVPMVHPNCRCVLIFEETDMPRPDKLSTSKLITTVADEIIASYTQRSAVADAPKDSDVLSKFIDLPKDAQISIIRKEIDQRTHGAAPDELDDDDDDLWDLVALGILDTLLRRKKREESVM